jgi:hypothetical protein
VESGAIRCAMIFEVFDILFFLSFRSLDTRHRLSCLADEPLSSAASTRERPEGGLLADRYVRLFGRRSPILEDFRCSGENDPSLFASGFGSQQNPAWPNTYEYRI